MMFRALFRLSLLLIVILQAASCKHNAGIKIGLMFPYTTSSRMPIEEYYFKQKASELGCEVVVTDAKSDEQLQRKQAQELIEGGVKAIVIMAVNAYTAAEIVRDAHNAGVKVIAYDRLIHNCDLDFYISHNNYNVGKYMAEYVLKLKPEGKYVLLCGDKSDRNAIFVKNGQVDVIKQNVQSGKIKILYDVFVEDWSAENAHYLMKKFLKLSSNEVPDVILSSYDGLAYGAVKALEECGDDPTKVIMTGQDAELQAIKNIISGKQTITIFKPLKILAEKAVEVSVDLVNGKKSIITTTVFNNRKNVESLLFDPVVVDKSNIKETVIKEGLYKESDVFGK
jgi:D-xylose transport system substrate-binding protein